MLYETCARAEELLQLNIEDLDLAARSAPVKSKGAKPRTRRRGPAHHEHVLETVYWDAGTARLIGGRNFAISVDFSAVTTGTPLCSNSSRRPHNCTAPGSTHMPSGVQAHMKTGSA
ncbi:hypothetical protein ACWZHB_10770 [Nocardia sp. FBN12]|uniref:hypothetical protein n=1 Tax=Nocardia sp. FBN12 TaxID=3419766 RepID=UPI003D07BDDA